MEIAKNLFFYQGRSGKSIRPGAGSSNVTVVRGDGLAMIDAGVAMGGAFRQLTASMAADGLLLTGLRWLLHTHCHWDHLNADGDLLTLVSPLLAAGEADVPFIEDQQKNFAGFFSDDASYLKEIFPYTAFVLSFLLWLAWGRQPAIKIDRPLADGDVIDLGRTIEAISLPGHTWGHMGFWIPDVKTLVLGDLIDFENAQGMDLNNPRSSYTAGLKSLERVLQLDAEIALMGHGAPVVGAARVRQLLDRAYAGAQQYPQRIRQVLSATPQGLSAITTAVFPNIPFSMQAMTMMLVLNVLLFLKEKGEVQESRTPSHRVVWTRID